MVGRAEASTPAKFISTLTAASLQLLLPFILLHAPGVVGKVAPPLQLAQMA